MNHQRPLRRRRLVSLLRDSVYEQLETRNLLRPISAMPPDVGRLDGSQYVERSASTFASVKIAAPIEAEYSDDFIGPRDAIATMDRAFLSR